MKNVVNYIIIIVWNSLVRKPSDPFQFPLVLTLLTNILQGSLLQCLITAAQYKFHIHVELRNLIHNC